MSGFGKVAFGLRCGKAVDGQFVKAWTKLLRSDAIRSGDVVLGPAAEFPHHFAAEMLMWEFLNRTDCDSIMFFDDDMVFSPTDVDQLRDKERNHPYSVVAGLACSSKGSMLPIVMRRTPGETSYSIADYKAMNGTLEVDCVGLAFTLVRRSVAEAVRRMAKPGHMMFAWGAEGTGEDESFCQKVQAAGGRVGVDTGCSVGHRIRLCVEWDSDKKAVGYYGQMDARFLKMMEELRANKPKES